MFSVFCKTKDLLMRQVSEHALSILKSKSIVLKWKRVVSVLSLLSLFSCINLVGHNYNNSHPNDHSNHNFLLRFL